MATLATHINWLLTPHNSADALTWILPAALQFIFSWIGFGELNYYHSRCLCYRAQTCVVELTQAEIVTFCYTCNATYSNAIAVQCLTRCVLHA